MATKHTSSRHKEQPQKKTNKASSLNLHAVDPASASTIFQPEFTPFSFEKWSKSLAIPEVKQPYAIQENSPWPDSEPLNIAPEFSTRNNKPYTQGAITWYEVIAQPGSQEIAPGVATEIWGYDGRWPGPTFKTRIGEQEGVVVRLRNQLDVELSQHLHGGHQPAYSDGWAVNTFTRGEYWDYYYPFTPPVNVENGEDVLDYSHASSTLWYHDHAKDITGPNVNEGLAGMWFTFDQTELDLIRNNIVPGSWAGSGRDASFDEDAFLASQSPYDVQLAIQDRRLNADGSFYYPEGNYDGFLGDFTTINGTAYPTLEVERRKYRFRILNGANARYYNLSLSDDSNFLVLGKDSWLYPEAVSFGDLYMPSATRYDVVIDFSNYQPGDTLYLEDNLLQKDGKGPKRQESNLRLVENGEQLMQFVVQGDEVPDSEDASVAEGTQLREHIPIEGTNLVGKRYFRMNRNGGMWTINSMGYDPMRVDANPELGAEELWVFENKAGGWNHPMHIHSESFEIIAINGLPPSKSYQYKNDVIDVGPNTTVELLVRFRTYEGKFMFHCHNAEHEDMLMMGTVGVGSPDLGLQDPGGHGAHGGHGDPIDAPITDTPTTDAQPDSIIDHLRKVIQTSEIMLMPGLMNEMPAIDALVNPIPNPASSDEDDDDDDSDARAFRLNKISSKNPCLQGTSKSLECWSQTWWNSTFGSSLQSCCSDLKQPSDLMAAMAGQPLL